jgi:cyclic dehypoxanthinyl futalosine synthase
MIEENVVAAAGTSHAMDEPGLRRLVREAGFTPRRRNVFYDLLPEPEDGSAETPNGSGEEVRALVVDEARLGEALGRFEGQR